MSKTSPRSALIAGLFFLSGFTALIYEVIWTRLLTLTFGVSTFAVAAVLMAFMGGLAGGSFLFGRLIDRRHDHLRLYGILELLIGVYACLLPWIQNAGGDLFVWIYRQVHPGFYAMSLMRLIFSMAILLFPTLLMGGTLPILAAGLTRSRGDTGTNTAWLYGINTLGAALGCLTAGFWFIPTWGLNGTTGLAALLNGGIFAVALACSRPFSLAHPSPTPEISTPTAPEYSRAVRTCAAAVIALSGFTAMVYQNIWTRVLAMVVGTTVYAFTIMLSAFLTGLVLGTFLYRRAATKPQALILGLAQIFIGFYVLWIMPWFDHLPFVFLSLHEATRNHWIGFQSVQFLFLFLIMLGPTTCFGFSFPAAVQILAQRDRQTGWTVGSAAGSNTLGAIAGAFVGGFVFIPFLGFQTGMLAAALLNVSAGVVMVRLEPACPSPRRDRLTIASLAVVLLAIFFLSPWNVHYLNSGVYVYADDYEQQPSLADLKTMLNRYQVLYYREEPAATVSVIESPEGVLSLTIDGKTDASSGLNADMSTQILLAHLPLFFTETPETGLNIGLGSGVTLGSMLRYPFHAVDAVEISRGVVEASRFFNEYNFNALDDPRVALIEEDGRHHLMRTDRVYDVVVSEPSNPWIAGVAGLFTKEFYHLVNQKMQPAGVLCQWLPSYHMTNEMLAVVCRTLRAEFPYVSLWTSTVRGDLLFIASREPLRLNFSLFKQRLQQSGIAADLRRTGFADPALPAKTFRLGPHGVEQWIRRYSDSLPLNTDMKPVLEYMTPRYLLHFQVVQGLDQPADFNADPMELLDMMEFASPEDRQKFEQLLRDEWK